MLSKIELFGAWRTSVDLGGDRAAPLISGPMPEAAAATCCSRVGYMPAATSAPSATFGSCGWNSTEHGHKQEAVPSFVTSATQLRLP